MRRVAFLSACVLLAAAAAAAGPGYRRLKSVTVGGDGGWDYLAVDSGRLFLSRGTRVAVLDADTLKPVGEIPETDGVHGVAFAPELGRGFVSAGKADSVVIFDLKTLKTLGTAKTGANPDAVLYDPSMKRVFAFDGKGKDATVIDAAAGTVLGVIPVGGKPEFAAADGRGGVFVNVEDTDELLSIDPAKMTVRARWPLSPCEKPTGLTIDAAGGRLFAVCRNKTMVVVDATTGKVVSSLPVGDGADAAAFDPSTGYAFSSNGDGTLTVVAPAKGGAYAVVQTVATRKGARTMALDLKTHRVYLVTADFDPAPAATPEQPHPRPTPKPGTFTVLVFGR